MANSNNNTLDMFYGFWKYLGVVAIFLIGISMFWWGFNLLVSDYVYLKMSMGPMANMIIAPLVVGLVLAWISITEFLRIIREEE